MSAAVGSLVDRFSPIGLAALDGLASLQTRRDRTYLVDVTGLDRLLAALPAGSTRALEVDARRWSRYESVYLDTPDLVTYHLAARRRPGRFKVRTRHYVDSEVRHGEVKVKSRRGATVKHRTRLHSSADDLRTVRELAARCAASAGVADSLRPVLTTHYRRAALYLSEDGARVTIDRDVDARNEHGHGVGLGERLVVETKTTGPPCTVDRLLWASGVRPTRFSKYATAMAALDPALPSNRWHRVIGHLVPADVGIGGPR